MKKLYTLLVVALIGFTGKAQIVNIPDANFKAKLLSANATNAIASTQTPDAAYTVSSYNSVDTNNDGEIQLSEVLAIKYLNLNQISFLSAIGDLTGIESFANLNYLSFKINGITSFNFSNLTNLKYLDCSSNGFSSLDVSSLSSLQYFDCSSNSLSSLGLNGLSNLQTLKCYSNQLASLNLGSLTNLHYLRCGANQLQAINVQGLTALEYLDCSSNNISSLNVQGLINLNHLTCSWNPIPALNVQGISNLSYLDCTSNQLTSLDLHGLVNLRYLYYINNQIPSLDVHEFTNLIELGCGGNQVDSLNIQGLSQLSALFCDHNLLTSLDVHGLTNLHRINCNNNQLTTLDIQGLSNMNNLDCSYNQLAILNLKCGNASWVDANANNNLYFAYNPTLQYLCADEEDVPMVQHKLDLLGYTNCTLNSYCSFTPGGTFYTVQGNSHFDSNNDGCTSSDIGYPNLKLSFSDGTQTVNSIADASGAYRYDLQAGTHTIVPLLENTSYFSVSPASATVTFPAATSPLIQDFCLSANGSHNDLEVVLLPIGTARPGFDAVYKIIYKNKGTGTQSGTVSLDFADVVEDFVMSSPNADAQSTNTLSWNFSSLHPFESREITLTLNINSPIEMPPVNAGNEILYMATITGAADETPNDNVSLFNQIMVNSLDPNSKTCTEGNQLPINEVGKYLHYIISFENNGTANAENIVVKDLIDTTKFDISTLIPLNGSHPFETKISETNKVEFIFKNINLPFDNANNDGYVAFKIKTWPTVADGQQIINTANIYFDYNAPITTNTNVVNVYNPLGMPDFEFSSGFTLAPVPAKNILTIVNKRDVMISSVCIYDVLGQLVQTVANPSQNIDVSGLKTGSYFIRITSDKGTATGKFLKQ